jgi:type II secretory pathway pseudopilin PulG
MDLAGQGRLRPDRPDGYAMAALLVGLSIMSVLLTMALPVWSHMARREREEELIWRGQQYARAIALFQRRYANTFPPSLDVLVEQRFLRKKYKDPITNDDFQLIPAGGAAQPGVIGGVPGAPTPGGQVPSTGQGGRGSAAGTTPTLTTTTPAGAGINAMASGAVTNLGISGVVSKSKDTSIKIYNGRQKYNEWLFVAMQTSQGVGGGVPGGAPGTVAPGGRGRGRGGFPGMQPLPGRGQPMPGRGFGPFGPGSPGMPDSGGMPPLPEGRGFQPVTPGQGSPFGVPQGQPVQPGGSMQPFGTLQKPPGG